MKCDELKAYTAYSVYNRAHTLEESLVYLKSEADNEIEFWKKESHDHYERWFNLNKQYEGWLGKVQRCESAESQLRYNKYKRCLAMAKWCVNGECKLKRVKMRDMNDHQFWQFDNDYWLKWNERWLELAEKFKEAK